MNTHGRSKGEEKDKLSSPVVTSGDVLFICPKTLAAGLQSYREGRRCASQGRTKRGGDREKSTITWTDAVRSPPIVAPRRPVGLLTAGPADGEGADDVTARRRVARD